MKELLVISHACANPINQEFFAQVEKITNWNITLVVPSNWRDEYGNQLSPKTSPEFLGKLIPAPVVLSGNIPLHFYRTAFARLIRAIHPDAIYVHQEPYAAVTAQIYLANRLTLRRPIGFFTWQNILKRYPFPFSLTERMVFEKSAFAFSGSFSAQRVLEQKGCPAALHVLPAGIDPLAYTPSVRDAELRAKLCADGEVLLGYLGRLTEEKGLATLLRGLARLRDLPWRLVVVGRGPYEAEFDRLSAELGLTERIRRLGYVPHPEAPRYLASFDVLVLPSETRPNWKEQFGRVLIEAMACGTPVLGSDSGEIPHLIADTGGGLVFPEGRPDALADRLRLLLVDGALRQELSERGRRHVLTHYDQKVVADRFARVLQDERFSIRR